MWQSTYLKKILGQYGMSNCELAKTPISPEVANSFTLYKDQVKKNIVAWYQSIIRVFMWPTMYAWLDLTYLVGVLSQFYNNPGLVHVELVKHVLQYISGTLDLGLKFNKKVDTLDDIIGYTEFDFSESKINWKSIRSNVFMLVDMIISHLFKLQSIIALSTCKTEYIIMCEARKEVI